MSDEALLPTEFADLEGFARVWSLPGMNERYERRLASSMDDMQAFYDAVVPRFDEAVAYLDRFELDDMADPALRLLWMLSSLSAVGFAVDVFKQPMVPDSNGEQLPWTVTPVP